MSRRRRWHAERGGGRGGGRCEEKKKRTVFSPRDPLSGGGARPNEGGEEEGTNEYSMAADGRTAQIHTQQS